MTNSAALPATELMDLRTYAERSGIPENVLRKWVASGDIPSHKIGKRRLINCYQLRLDLEALTAQEVKAA